MFPTFKNEMIWLQNTFHSNAWIIATFIIVFMTLLLHTVEAVIYRRLYAKFEKTKNIWDDSLLYAIHLPLGFLIWLLGISFAAEFAGTFAKTKLGFLAFVPQIREIGVVILLVWFLIRLIRQVEINLLKPTPGKKPVNQTTVHAIAQLMIASVIITAVLVALQMSGIDISAVLAFGGIGGIAIGFAAKDLLGNFFGGLMIYLDRPFNVGDWIRSPDKNIEGTVESIGWRLTRIRTFDRRPLYVPNGIFSTIAVENPSRMQNRRIRSIIGLRYHDATKIDVIIQDIKKMLRAHPEIETSRTLIVNLVEFGPSSLNIMVYTFTKTTDWVAFQEIQQDIFLKIIEIITTHGAECAFPSQTLYMPEAIKVEGR